MEYHLLASHKETPKWKIAKSFATYWAALKALGLWRENNQDFWFVVADDEFCTTWEIKE